MPKQSRGGEHLDAILALVAAGATVTAACGSNPAFPKPNAIAKLCQRNAGFRARLQDAIRTSGSRRRFSAAEFDQALAAIRSTSGNLREILVAPMPTYQAVIQRAGAHPDFGRRYRAAVAEHDNPKYLKPADYLAALEAIRARPDLTIAAALTAAGRRLPSTSHLHAKIQADAKFAALAAPALALRRDTWAHQRKIDAKPKTVYAKNLLAKSLQMDSLYAVAERAVPRHLDEFDRDDIRAELILAMIEGSLSVDDVERAGKQFVKDFMKRNNRIQFSSLDTGGSRTDGEAWVDTFTADRWHA